MTGVGAESCGVVVYRATGGVDAIDEHSRRLVGAMRAGGTAARYVPDGLAGLGAATPEPPWILLQYNPFRYGRAGIAPGLVREASRLRRRCRAPLAVMVHEAWVEMSDPRSTLVGACQRAQLRALLALADGVMTSTQALAGELGARAVHVPVATNVTPLATTPALARARLGIADRLVLSLFGRANPSRALDHARRAIAAVARRHGAGRVVVLNLGAGAPALDVPAGVEVRSPGHLDDAELSRWLWASDLVLLPFTDGASTRRTTLMAALAHGRPVVALRGRSTDSVLTAHADALVLTPAGDPEGFVRATVEMAGDAERRVAVGAAGRRLYEARFDWPVLARKVAGVLAGLSPGRLERAA